MQLSLVFGALAKTVSQQVQEQFGDLAIDLPHFDEDAEALTRAYIRGLLTDSEIYKARKRLMKKITSYLNTHPV